MDKAYYGKHAAPAPKKDETYIIMTTVLVIILLVAGFLIFVRPTAKPEAPQERLAYPAEFPSTATNPYIVSDEMRPLMLAAHADDSKLFWWERLTDNAKCSYERIWAQLDFGSEIIFLDECKSMDEAVAAWEAVLKDCPEYSYTDRTFQYVEATDALPPYIIVNYTFDDFRDALAREEECEQAAKELAEEAKERAGKGASNVAIANEICYLLAHRACYIEGRDFEQEASGVLLDGRGVCASYARAFVMCCRAVDIPAVYVVGKADGETHAWACIFEYSLAHWYDPCWYDSPGGEKWADMDEKEFLETHEFGFTGLFECG